MEVLYNLNPVSQAFLAGIFTWMCTLLGSAIVFISDEVNKKVLAVSQGFSGGVMIAASFWSLLSPAIDRAEESAQIPAWIPVAIGFIAGGLFLLIIDKIVPHLHISSDHGDSDFKGNSIPKNWKLFLAVTIHNIPEGMAIGVALAGAAIENTVLAYSAALSLIIGIGIQNIPEGAALALPIRASGSSKWKSFNLAQTSALVEPLGAALGALAVLTISTILPYALSFAAGAMIFVVIEDLIPESQSSGYTDLATVSFIFGFAAMMILDVALG